MKINISRVAVAITGNKKKRNKEINAIETDTIRYITIIAKSVNY
jgi:hypothetical protein